MDPVNAQAMFNEAVAQRNFGLDRCTVLAGQVATLQARIAELEKNQKPPKKAKASDAKE